MSESKAVRALEKENNKLRDRIKGLEKRIKVLHRNRDSIYNQKTRNYKRIKELEASLEQHRWIPVSERLPEKEQKNSVMSKEVFVSDGREVWKARCVVSGKRWSYTNSPSATLPITHWKPIILPKEKGG